MPKLHSCPEKRGKIKLCIDFSRADCQVGHIPDTHFSMGALVVFRVAAATCKEKPLMLMDTGDRSTDRRQMICLNT